MVTLSPGQVQRRIIVTVSGTSFNCGLLTQINIYLFKSYGHRPHHDDLNFGNGNKFLYMTTKFVSMTKYGNLLIVLVIQIVIYVTTDHI